MSDTDIHPSDGVATEVGAEPCIEQLLASSNWEKQLGEAREQRKKILAKRQSAPREPSIIASGFSPDQADIAGQLVKSMQRCDSPEAESRDTLTEPENDFSHRGAILDPGAATPLAESREQPLIVPPATHAIGKRKTGGFGLSRGLAVLLSCCVGLGIGLSIGIGLIFGVERLSRDTAESALLPKSSEATSSGAQPSQLSDLAMGVSVNGFGLDTGQTAMPQNTQGFGFPAETVVIPDLSTEPTATSNNPVLVVVLPDLAQVEQLPLQTQQNLPAFAEELPVVVSPAPRAPVAVAQDILPARGTALENMTDVTALLAPNATTITTGSDLATSIDIVSPLASLPLNNSSVKATLALLPQPKSPNFLASVSVPSFHKVSAYYSAPVLKSPALDDQAMQITLWDEHTALPFAETPTVAAASSEQSTPFVQGPPERTPTLAEELGLTTQTAKAFKLYIHAPESVTKTALNAQQTQLDETGFPITNVQREPFKISATHIRFYDRADAKVAKAIAADIGVKARDFTANGGYSGRIEIWMSGKPDKKIAAKKRKPKSTRSSGTPAKTVDPMAQLRQKLANKLRRGEHL